MNVNFGFIEFGEKLKETIFNVRKYKSEKNLSLKDEIENVTIECTDKQGVFFEKTIEDIRACCNAKKTMIN